MTCRHTYRLSDDVCTGCGTVDTTDLGDIIRSEIGIADLAEIEIIPCPACTDERTCGEHE